MSNTKAAENGDSSRETTGVFNYLLKVPCMRDSLLSGYVGAVVGGIAGFFYNSCFRFATNSAFVSYWIVATGTWIKCRYDFEKRKLDMKELKQLKMANLKTNEYNIPTMVQKMNSEDNSYETPDKDS